MKINDKDYLPTIYKPGYTESIDKERREVHMYDDKGLYYLEKDFSENEARIEYLKRMVRGTSCAEAGRSAQNKYMMLEKIYYEAKSLGANEKDLKWFRLMAAYAAVAPSSGAASAKVDQAVSEFLKYHLK